MVRYLCGGKAAGVDEIWPGILKVLDKAEGTLKVLDWAGVVNIPLQCGLETWGSAFGLANWDAGPYF